VIDSYWYMVNEYQYLCRVYSSGVKVGTLHSAQFTMIPKLTMYSNANTHLWDTILIGNHPHYLIQGEQGSALDLCRGVPSLRAHGQQLDQINMIG